MKVLTSLLKDESGVTAIEYSLIAALIGVAAVASLTLMGTDISTTFSTVLASSSQRGACLWSASA